MKDRRKALYSVQCSVRKMHTVGPLFATDICAFGREPVFSAPYLHAGDRLKTGPATIVLAISRTGGAAYTVGPTSMICVKASRP